MYDYSLEKKLSNDCPELHKRIQGVVAVLQGMLDSFYNWFPDFTDHSILHSLDVLDFCNKLLGDQVKNLNSAECYSLIMACYLHDIGMGVSRKDLETYEEKRVIKLYRKEHPDAASEKLIRDQHSELSGFMIHDYSDLFDIPSEGLEESVILLSRGHRKTDLLDESVFHDIYTPYGIVRAAYLSAILRIADEIDVGADRNPEILFDTSKLTQQKDIDAFGTHESIRTVEVSDDHITLHVKPKEEKYGPMVENLRDKIQDTLDYCRDVAAKRSDLSITQETVDIVYL